MSSRYFINKVFIVAFSIFLLGNNVFASPTWYGKIFVDAQSFSNDVMGTKTDIKNNSSRLGLKGEYFFSENSNLRLIYQAEYQFDPVDGKARGDDGTLKQRNTFLGIKSNIGTLFAGTHDSALKKSQLKIDLFNDLAPDIKNILHGENRLEDFIGYTTPKYKNMISATFNSIKNPSSGKKYKSYSINFSGDAFQAAIGIDDSMKGYDSSRISILIPINKFKIGLLAQKTKNLVSGQSDSGHVTSLSRKISSKGTFKIQRSSSNMKISTGRQTTIGYDYQFKKYLKIFTFYSQLESSNNSKERDIFSIGLEYKF